MTPQSTNADKYDIADAKSKKHMDAIVNSPSRKKVVVAGPGTGKTFLFKKIVKGKKCALTLTFVNALVEDLSLELYGMSEVKTLHSFARSKLGSTNKNVEVSPELSEVIQQDAKILLKEDDIDFNSLFHNMDGKSEHIAFYKNRKDYYGKYYGYSDIVFELVKHFQDNKNNLPTYDQVLVDEYQDFNKLEITLIELLSEKSPILIAGDDDQALYEELKSASAKHIRDKFDRGCRDYESFTLPHCRRCTRVIVEATNDIISTAAREGYMSDRIPKKYEYFDHKEKDKVSKQNPKIIYTQLYERQIPWFIEKQLKGIAQEIKDKFSVLIISPTKIKCQAVVKGLKKKGFTNIEWSDRSDKKEPTLLDGLKLLLKDKDSNLGWRIIAHICLKDKDFEGALIETCNDATKRFSDLISSDTKKEVKEILKTLKLIKDDKSVKDEKLDTVLRKVGFDFYGIAKENLKEEILFDSEKLGDPGLRKIPIKVTTVESSKGLSADYVFITCFDDRYFIKDKTNITDKDICKFIVSLTRAKRKAILIASDTNKNPTFLNWINSDRIEKV